MINIPIYALLPLTLFIATAHAAGTLQAPAAIPEVTAHVETAIAKEATTPITITAYGSVVPDPKTLSNLSAVRSGVVAAIYAYQGQLVKTGEPLIAISTSPENSNQFSQLQSALDFAKGELARIESMFKQKMATESQVMSAKQALLNAEVAVKTQEKLGNNLATQVIRAQADSIITRVLVRKGDYIQPGALLLTYADPANKMIHLSVSPKDIAHIKPQAQVDIKLLNSNTTGPITGSVDTVGSVVNPDSKQIDVMVQLPKDTKEKVLLNTPVQASIQMGEAHAWLVPKGAILWNKEQPYIYQVDKDSRAKAHEVTLVGENKEESAITGSFLPVDPIIVKGSYQVSEGMKIEDKGTL